MINSLPEKALFEFCMIERARNYPSEKKNCYFYHFQQMQYLYKSLIFIEK